MAKKKGPRETSIVKSIIENLNSRPGVLARKVHGGRFGANGWPDIEVFFVPEPVTDAEKANAGWIRNHDRREYRRPDGYFAEGLARAFFLEAKRPGETSTPIQLATQAKLIAVGAPVAVVTSKAEAIAFLTPYGLPPVPPKEPQERRR